MSNSLTSLRGRNNKNPDVGLGVVGKNTVAISSPLEIFVRTSPRALVEMNAIAQIPLRGYSIKQALSNDVSRWENTVSAICLTPL